MQITSSSSPFLESTLRSAPSVADRRFMRRALFLAKKGLGRTSPNPCVGAVVVSPEGVIVGEGYHQKSGLPHAEIEALLRAGNRSKGATLYLTLEPCCHTGKTPPCTDAILKSGVSRVIAACRDPFLVRGKSGRILKKSGISLFFGLLEKEARALNQIFFKNVLKKLPYVTAKVAMTLDGKIASFSGESRGITGEKSLRYVHILRSRHDAVMVGAGTVLKDDPHLGVRLVSRRLASRPDPLRIILDANLRSPVDAKVFRDQNVVVFTDISSVSASHLSAFKKKRDLFSQKGVRIFSLSSLTPSAILKKLYEEGVRSILCEGGNQVFTSFWDSGNIDRYITFIAPKLCGGEKSLTPLSGSGIEHIGDFNILKSVRFEQFGEDVCIDGFLSVF